MKLIFFQTTCSCTIQLSCNSKNLYPVGKKLFAMLDEKIHLCILFDHLQVCGQLGLINGKP